jgi:hypothetical protein
MTNALNSAAARAAAPSLTPALRPVAQAAQLLLPDLERGKRIDAGILRVAMESGFGASDVTGGWDWKAAYDACEAATVLFLRKFGPALRARATSPAAMLPMLARIAGLLPTHTRRSEESQAFQQFSTPIPLGLAACTAAAVTSADRVLEPSAGTEGAPSIRSCALIVTRANDLVGDVHQHRMPVFLQPNNITSWLNGFASAELLVPARNELLHLWRVSRRINEATAKDDASLIAPLTALSL